MSEPERWTIHELDDTATQETPLRARALALAALGLVVVVLVFAGQSRTGVADPAKTPAPTFSRNDSGTALPSEAETWGAIWSRANGIVVLRPTWLPKSADEYEVDSYFIPNQRLIEYDTSYIAGRTPPGAAVWHIEFMANPLEDPARLIQLGAVPQTETVMVRGHAAQLRGIPTPLLWQLVWSEGDYRYAIQAFAVSREELLRIAESLAPVIDRTGQTNP